MHEAFEQEFNLFSSFPPTLLNPVDPIISNSFVWCVRRAFLLVRPIHSGKDKDKTCELVINSQWK